MEKRISFYEFQSVKSVAKAVDPIIRKRNKVQEQVVTLAEQYKAYDAQIKALEAGIVQVIGFHVEDLVKKVIETDAKGNKITKYLPTDIVTYDNEKKQYIISVPDEAHSTEELPGSDFDIDAETVESESAEIEPTEAEAIF